MRPLVNGDAEIERSIDLAAGAGAGDPRQQGIDAILIVLNLAACVTSEELRALDAVRDRLGHRSFERRGVVVWTHADRLEVRTHTHTHTHTTTRHQWFVSDIMG